MEDQPVPAELQQFLLDHVQNYEQLSLLVLLGSNPERVWTVGEASAGTGMPPEYVQDALRSLAAADLMHLQPGPPDTFTMTAGDTRQLLIGLAALFDSNRLAVMRAMNANAISRVRTGAARAFSSAFLIGKKKKDG
jgi:hypothetical protein